MNETTPTEIPAVDDPLKVSDRVTFSGEVRRIGEKSGLVRFESGWGMIQYVWIKLANMRKQ